MYLYILSPCLCVCCMCLFVSPPCISQLLEEQDEEVLTHTCWALSHLCDGPATHLRQLLALIPNLCPRLVQCPLPISLTHSLPRSDQLTTLGLTAELPLTRCMSLC